MALFESIYQNITYEDVIQLDGSFSASHIKYNSSPLFNGKDSLDLAKKSRKKSLSHTHSIDNILDYYKSFNGTDENLKKNDQKELWKNYWLEYINAYDKLLHELPNSIVTTFLGRQSIELGFKYLILNIDNSIARTHNLRKLSGIFFSKYSVDGKDYMKYIDNFCHNYTKYIEGENVEYFRYPEYKCNKFFAGNYLDLKWVNYNFSLILLKLLHFAKLDL